MGLYADPDVALDPCELDDDDDITDSEDELASYGMSPAEIRAARAAEARRTTRRQHERAPPPTRNNTVPHMSSLLRPAPPPSPPPRDEDKRKKKVNDSGLVAHTRNRYVVDTGFPVEGVVNLPNGNLSVLPSEVLFSQPSLVRELRAPENKIIDLPEGFGVLRNLEVLDLSSNRLVRVPESLGDLDKLTHLNLNNNRLVSLPQRISGCLALKRLEAAKNGLGVAPMALWSLPALTYVNLRWNNLTSLPGGVASASSLQVLYLTGNQLRRIPGALGKLKKLKILDVGENCLESLPAELVAGCKKLRALDVSGNALTALPMGLDTLPALQGLYMNANRVASLPEGWGASKSLKEWYARDNDLVTLPGGLRRAVNLEMVDLSGNKLKAVPGRVLAAWTKVKGLELAANRLTELPEMGIAGMTSLTVLNLQNNYMTRLPVSLATGPGSRLQKLFLAGNTRMQFPPPHLLSVGLSQTMAYLRDVAKAPVCAPKCTAEGPGLNGPTVGVCKPFTVMTYNPMGMPMSEGGVVLAVSLTMDGKSGSIGPDDVRDCKNGSYIVKLTPPVAGRAQISVAIDGVHIAGSPFDVVVRAGEPVASMCHASGDGLTAAVAGIPASFTVVAVDGAGNPRTAGAEFDVRVLPSVKMTARDIGNGGVLYTYTPVVATDHQITIRYAGSVIGAGGKTRVKVEPGPTAASRCELARLSSAVAMQTSTAELLCKDACGNARRSSGGEVVVAWLTGPRQVPVAVSDRGDGRYGLNFKAPVPGAYRMSITVNNDDVLKKPAEVSVVSAGDGGWTGQEELLKRTARSLAIRHRAHEPCDSCDEYELDERISADESDSEQENHWDRRARATARASAAVAAERRGVGPGLDRYYRMMHRHPGVVSTGAVASNDATRARARAKESAKEADEARRRLKMGRHVRFDEDVLTPRGRGAGAEANHAYKFATRDWRHNESGHWGCEREHERRGRSRRARGVLKAEWGEVDEVGRAMAEAAVNKARREVRHALDAVKHRAELGYVVYATKSYLEGLESMFAGARTLEELAPVQSALKRLLKHR